MTRICLLARTRGSAPAVGHHSCVAVLHRERAWSSARSDTRACRAGSWIRTTEDVKSKSNVVTPGILEKYGSDAVRYWAASARLGLDAAFDEAADEDWCRLAIKVLNASKFALTMGGEGAAIGLDPALVTVPLVQCWQRSLPSLTGLGCPQPTSALEVTSRSSGRSATTTWSWSRSTYNRDGAWDEGLGASARCGSGDRHRQCRASAGPFRT